MAERERDLINRIQERIRQLESPAAAPEKSGTAEDDEDEDGIKDLDLD